MRACGVCNPLPRLIKSIVIHRFLLGDLSNIKVNYVCEMWIEYCGAHAVRVFSRAQSIFVHQPFSSIHQGSVLRSRK
jgi:hypothetical protein